METSTESNTDLNNPYTRRWIYLLPALGILWVWLSSLAFVPVPWPDDSAFYFPAKDLFSWPPRWVMIPQAPFEPTYREWNFNTMPLFPIWIGILRFFGIDGSQSLKLLPLLGWATSTGILLYGFRKARAPLALLLACAGLLLFDPILRWSSVLLRPESWIGAYGVAILVGYRFGWPDAFRERRFFDPYSAALALAALLHFNAIHLVPVVVALFWRAPRRVFKIGALTALYLVPWLATIALRPSLFFHQMELQFARLGGYQNPWLNSWAEFVGALLSDMGSPEPWSAGYRTATTASVFLGVGALAITVTLLRKREFRRSREGATLIAGFVWVLSSAYLWHTKAEVWFTHFLHLSFWVWTALVVFEAQRAWQTRALVLPLAIVALVFGVEQVAQTLRLERTRTWHWSAYEEWIDCIDRTLVAEFDRRGRPDVFRVWAPNYPDILIELSKKHPRWEFTRTNDFPSRWDLGVAHGYAVEAMVVTEIFRPDEQFFSGELADKADLRSVWMGWTDYFLNRLERDPKFKPRRKLCQHGRWDAFIYFE